MRNFFCLPLLCILYLGVIGCSSIQQVQQGRGPESVQRDRVGSPQERQVGQVPQPRSRVESAAPTQPNFAQTGDTAVGKLVTEKLNVPTDRLPKPWFNQHIEASVPNNRRLECLSDAPMTVGLPNLGADPVFRQFWAAQSKLLRLEQAQVNKSQIDEVVSAKVGVDLLNTSMQIVEILLTGWKPDPSLRQHAKKSVDDYNTSFYAPEVFLTAVSRLAKKTDVIEAIIDYQIKADLAFERVN